MTPHTFPTPRPTLACRFTRAALFIGLAGTASALWAASFLGVDVPAPLPAKNVVDTYWGTPVDDPYRFLENTKDPLVQSWMKAQADSTNAILAKLPARDALLARIAEIDRAVPSAVSSVQRSAAGRYFYLRRNTGDNQFKLVYRDSPEGPDTVLVDPEVLAKATGKPHAIGGFTPSPDGKRVAYSISAGGTEIGTQHVLDVASGQEIDRPIPAVRGSGSVSWLPDSKGFFYFRLKLDWASLPATERFQDNLRYLRILGAAGEDAPVFGPGVHADVSVPRSAYGYVFAVEGTPLAASLVRDGVKREQSLYLADMADVLNGKARWRKVFGEEARVTETTISGGWVYVKTAAQAPRYRVLRMPLASPDLAKAEVVVAASDDVVLETGAARDAFYVTQRQGPVTRLLRVLHTAGATAQPVDLPLQGHVDLMFTDPAQDGTIFQLSSWTRATTLHQYQLPPSGRAVAATTANPPAASPLQPLPLVSASRFDAPPGLLAREARVKSHDGVEVPLSIISRADIKLDGRNPTILSGYGAYGITETPGWNPRLLAWLERGGVFVIAHVRGGGVFGDGWHRAGQKTTKANTWKDGIAAAEWLIAQGYTAPDRLAVQGGSAGGIFVGRAFTARPDLFAAAVVSVGNTDLVRSETRANGIANIHEYGTVKIEAEFRALLDMSPYANTREGAKYPAVYFEHGVNDSRVDVWMALKTGSRLAASTSSGKPVLLRLEYDGGHGVGATREQAQRRSADRWAFLLWQFGVDKPAP
jgi:prolyl oligopeptidase